MFIMAGDEEEPFIARVVDIVEGPGWRQIIHVDVVGVPDNAFENSGNGW
jgi:hypothetical protein